jgi:hypothetical protein
MFATTDRLLEIDLAAVARPAIKDAAGRAVGGTAAAEARSAGRAGHKDLAAGQVVAVVAGVARCLAMLAPAANKKKRLFRQKQTKVIFS